MIDKLDKLEFRYPQFQLNRVKSNAYRNIFLTIANLYVQISFLLGAYKDTVEGVDCPLNCFVHTSG